MARTQSKLYPEIRQGILKSAANLFAEKGFSTTTIVDLAAACQSSRGALYHYFSSKEEILTQILEEHVSSMLDVLVQLGEDRVVVTRGRRGGEAGAAASRIRSDPATAATATGEGERSDGWGPLGQRRQRSMGKGWWVRPLE